MKHKKGIVSLLVCVLAVVCGIIVFDNFNQNHKPELNYAENDPYLELEMNGARSESSNVSSSGRGININDQLDTSSVSLSEPITYTGKEGLIQYIRTSTGQNLAPKMIAVPGEELAVSFQISDFGQKITDFKNEEEYWDSFSEPVVFKVNSWVTSKSFPTEMSEGYLDIIRGLGRAEIDDTGTITNGYSYVMIDISVRNDSTNNYSGLLWGTIYLKSQAGSSDFSGECQIVADGRPDNKQYCAETIPASSDIKRKIIYIVSDKSLNNTLLWLEINPTGGVMTGRDIKGYIVLN